MASAHQSSDTKFEEDAGVSMVEILAEEERLEADAHAVLGGTDDKNCTYSLGYVSRQPLYACITCIPVNSNRSAGICLACSYECHDGHELIELYTKRSFRCDCGNSCFPDTECKLYTDKETENSCNKYNHNFQGVYCTCARPYPDPQEEVEDEMLQCVVCEDWYHGRHLGVSVPDNQDYSEMICTECMTKHDFLWAYAQPDGLKDDSSSEVHESSSLSTSSSSRQSSDVSSSSSSGAQSSDVSSSNSRQSDASTTGSSDQSVVRISSDSSVASDTPSKTDIDATSSYSDTNNWSGPCYLYLLKAWQVDALEHATFWPDGWRTKLCRCKECMRMYKEKDIMFLIDVKDTVEAYEEQSRSQGEPVSQHAKEMNALSQMDRVQQIEIMHGFNDLKSELRDYLKKFAENGKVVREEDIKEFFSSMQARKRQKTEHGMQHTCK